MVDQKSASGEARELPAAFVEEMEHLFAELPGVSGAELPGFFGCLQGERSFGLKRNPLKFSEEEFEARMPFALEKIPWTDEGYFYRAEEQPGKSPYHEAGAYYIQEPSAMIVAKLLGVKPGERVADLCAAPGGKSAQIAGKMRGEGVLVCNEYVPARAEILAQNMERMGASNCVILRESVDRVAERFPLFFDRVLVDAPCSGEGMFRKEEQALAQWSLENVEMCAKRQREILEEAAKMIRPGGVLVYSTCTFSEAENEANVRWFIKKHPYFYMDGTCLTKELLGVGVCPGGMPGTVRMWPHKLRGEGHFAARLIRAGESREGKHGETERKSKGREMRSEQEKWGDFHEFCGQSLRESCLEAMERQYDLVWRMEHLYGVPKQLPDLGNLRVQRGGLHLGEAKKGRFEPSHTWAMTLKRGDVLQSVEVEDAAGYLRGETLENEGWKGWVLVLFSGIPLGWGKAAGNVVKNHYPRGLRK